MSYPQTAGFKDDTTSRDAALSTPADALRKQVIELLQAHGPMTADEAAARLDASPFAIRPRFTELRALGLIERTGIRRTNATGKAAHVCRATRLI